MSSHPPPHVFSFYPAWPPPLGVPLANLLPDRCGYLAGRTAQCRGFSADSVDGATHEEFMHSGFRRAGRLFYQPVCSGCRACTPIRVPVAMFRPSRSQRRCVARNTDLRVEVAKPKLDDERLDLFSRYQTLRHREPTPPTRSELHRFLYDSPINTVEVCIRNGSNRLLSVGICDLGPNSLSTVYCFYDVSQLRRGLGTLSALVEIQYAQRLGLTRYYLGYWVPGCRTMDYKRSFRPCEVLGTDGIWRPLDP